MRLNKWTLVAGLTLLAALVTYAQRPLPTKSSSRTSVSKPATQPNERWESFSCWEPRLFYKSQDSFKAYTREVALRTRNEVVAKGPKWLDLLPCCPETYDYVQQARMWATEEPSFAGCFHPGAYYDVRTSQMYHRVTSSQSGQQCTYTQQGRLIYPGQPGAGTPDFVSPTVDKEKHWLYDVYPWTRLTLHEYVSAWKPNPGCNTPIRYSLHPDSWTNLWMYVLRGDVITFSGAMGQVKFDVEGNVTGPEGSRVVPKTDMGLLGRILYDNPLPDAPPGALIGAVYNGRFVGDNGIIELNMADMTAGFLIGRGAMITIGANGYLMLGINDGFLENNSGWLEVTVQRSGNK